MRSLVRHIVIVIVLSAFLTATVVACTSPAPEPTPDIQATVEAAVAEALPTATPTPSPDIEATIQAAVAATVAAVATATQIVEPNPLYVQGRNLWMRADKPIIQDAVHYVGRDTAGNQHAWAIEPVRSGTRIAVVEVTIINATSSSVRLVVDRDAAELRLRDVSQGVKPVDVIEKAVPTTSYDPTLDYAGFVPIWGSITLNSNEQILGHMVFEIPVGAPPLEFRWRASDTMYVRY